MSYTPTDWKTGDVITAEKLNNMEAGISDGQQLYVLSLIQEETQDRLDKTFGEIKSAVQAGKVIIISCPADGDEVFYNGYLLGMVMYSKNGEGGSVLINDTDGQTIEAVALTDDDYPAYSI